MIVFAGVIYSLLGEVTSSRFAFSTLQAFYSVHEAREGQEEPLIALLDLVVAAETRQHHLLQTCPEDDVVYPGSDARMKAGRTRHDAFVHLARSEE